MRNPARLLHRHGHGAFEGSRTDHYNRMANGLWSGVYKRPAADIAAAAPPGAELLDVGTGPGRLLVELARLRADLKLTGLDVSKDMVAHAGHNLAPFGDRAAALVGDVARLPFPDDSFDVIVSSLSVHHWPDVPAGAAELGRVLRPGGQLRIYDFSFAGLDRVGETVRARPEFAGREVRIDRFRIGFFLGSRRLVV
jgi:ubiquinone/menaquinone biosynthesis C-methylase UbiE